MYFPASEVRAKHRAFGVISLVLFWCLACKVLSIFRPSTFFESQYKDEVLANSPASDVNDKQIASEVICSARSGFFANNVSSIFTPSVRPESQ